MATFTKTSSIGGLSSLVLTFDDVAMTLNRIDVTNNADRIVHLSFGGNYILERDVESGGGEFSILIPTAKRPSYEIVTVPNSDNVGTKQVLQITNTSIWFGTP